MYDQGLSMAGGVWYSSFFFFFFSSDAPFSSPRAISCPRYVDLAAG